MNTSLEIIQLVIGLVIFIGILLLMVRKKSNANISLIWLLIAVAVMILALFPRIIDFVAYRIGIQYPPTLIIVVAIVAIIWIVFYMSSQLAVAQTKIRELAMQISLLNNEMASLKGDAKDKK
ncbi:hypothetical protein FACS189492_2310 [Clostridia bacterium]|nr:hypothetical protein FACS189492_2310 [Clostridia bacterium]